MNNKTEAYNRLVHTADALLHARDAVKQAQIAFTLDRAYQAQGIVKAACDRLKTAMEDLEIAVLIGQSIANDKQGRCPQFKEAEK